MLPLVQEPLRTPAGLETWFFAHAQDHQEIVDAIRKATGLRLTVYPINYFNKANSETWKAWHQQMHNDMAAVLGISVSELEDVDLDDAESARDWFYLNFRDHEAAHQELGIG